jgi:hypothetical protein
LLQLDPPMNQLLFGSLGDDIGRRFLPPTHGTESSSDFRLPEGKKIVAVRPLMFVLTLAVGVGACLGTILALFTWTAASL